MTNTLAFLAFAAVTTAAASFGALFQPGAWYLGLVKPSWTPPGWLFGPVWTVLYVMIAIAGWLVWRRHGVNSRLFMLWALGLALNAAWSWLMFGQHNITLALVDIVLLLASIVAFIAAAWSSVPRAAYLFIPYAAWVSFAIALNFAIWRLNA